MPVVGLVTTLQRNRIRGWAVDTENPNYTIDICIEDRKIKSIRPVHRAAGFAAINKGVVGFKFRLGRKLIRYLPRPDALSFSVGGTKLPVLKNELWVYSKARQKPVAELFERLSNGYVITKKGDLRLSIHLDHKWQEEIFAFYTEARKKFFELFGYDLYIVSGTLLGWKRSGSFIPGDDDFDVSYLSKHTDPALIRAEFISIVKTLKASGGLVTGSPKRRSLLTWHKRSGVALDVFPSWISGDHYYMTFAIGGPCAAAIKQGFEEVDFLGRNVLAPIAAEAWLETAYGPGWHTPDPLWQWAVKRSIHAEIKKIRMTRIEHAEIFGSPQAADDEDSIEEAVQESP